MAPLLFALSKPNATPHAGHYLHNSKWRPMALKWLLARLVMATILSFLGGASCALLHLEIGAYFKILESKPTLEFDIQSNSATANSATTKFPLQRRFFDSPPASHRPQCIKTPSTTNHFFYCSPGSTKFSRDTSHSICNGLNHSN